MKYNFFYHYVSPLFMICIFAIIFFFWYIDYLQRPYRILQNKMDYLIFAFLIWVIFSALFGLTKDYPSKFFTQEIIYVPLYISYFIFKDLFKDFKIVGYIMFFFLGITFITSIQYILLFFSEADFSTIIFNRVVTQQTHIILIGFMLLLNITLFSKHKLHRILALGALLPHILAIFFSQQRALWIASFIGLVFIVFINGKRSFSKRAWVYVWVGIFSILTSIIFFLIYIEEAFGGSLIFTFFSRIDFLFALNSDVSFTARTVEIWVALKQWELNPLLGTGLGSFINRFAIMGNSPIVDNSYVNFLWKMGLVGFSIYISILCMFFIMGFHTLIKSESQDIKNFVSALLIAFGSLMIVALTNSCLYIYRFNIIWAMLFAIIQRYYEYVKDSEHENLHGR